MRAVFFLAAAGAAAAQTVTQKIILHQSQPVGYGPMYTTTGLSRHKGGQPTAMYSTWLNPPTELVAYNYSSNGQPIWTLTPESALPFLWYDIASAHFQSSAGAATGAVDAISVMSNDDYPSDCTLYGTSTTGATAANGGIAWQFTVPACLTGNSYDQFDYIDISDDGTFGAALLFVNGTGGTRLPNLYALSPQTGKTLWIKTLDVDAGAYGVQISRNSAFLIVGLDDTTGVNPNRTAVILNAKDGSQRGSRCNLFWNIPPAISADGGYVIGGTQGALRFWQWSNTDYTQLQDIVIPPLNIAAGDVWVPVDLEISTFTGADGKVHNYASTTWMTAVEDWGRFTMFDLDALAAGAMDGTILVDYIIGKNLHEWDDSIVRVEGAYATVGAWGGDTSNEFPTVFLFKAGVMSKPLWTFTTQGSVLDLDIIVQSGSGNGNGTDVVHLATAGVGNDGGSGNGGDAFWWQLTVSQ